jgi:hypothetical protein
VLSVVGLAALLARSTPTDESKGGRCRYRTQWRCILAVELIRHRRACQFAFAWNDHSGLPLAASVAANASLSSPKNTRPVAASVPPYKSWWRPA